MAFRIEKAVGVVLLFGAIATADGLAAPVCHKHLRKGALGRIEIGAAGIAFTEPGRHAVHSREWKYEDIQQLTLSPAALTVLTYDDQKWQFGRDREYVFDQLPQGFAARIYPAIQNRLGPRFAAHLRETELQTEWEIPAKFLRRFGGTQGTLLAGTDRIEFKAGKDSFTWLLADIENISTASPFDLSIMTLERSGVLHSSTVEYRFQLKAALSEDRYNELWRKVSAAKGVQVLQPVVGFVEPK